MITHNKQTVVTDPKEGKNYYKNWGVFPNKSVPIRKITLHVKFGCPDSMRCADWDYLDFITIKRVGGAHAEEKNFEIARMLTPYGGAFAKDWKFDWAVDVTDFSLLLRDSVEIEYNHTGYEPNKDRGWKITLDFEIIKGKPVAEPISIQEIYHGGYKYGDSLRSIEEDLVPIKIKKMTGADYAKLRILQTGHGANEGDYCGEFCSKKRTIIYNGQEIDTRPIWKKCGDNPLYPQAGTWLYDRAHWCPGYLQIPDEYLLPLQDDNTVDINMEPYSVSKTEAVENIAAYVIQYKKVAASNDVSILDIVKPTNKELYARKNPDCSNAVIVVKNNGLTTLKTLLIQYVTKGFSVKKYHWKGNLSYGAQAEIVLPGSIDAKKGENYFTVSLLKPNGKNDAFPQDNTMAANFVKSPIHTGGIVVVVKTNDEPQDNSFTIKNASGTIVFSRSFDSTMKNKIFKDTLSLATGCYTFNLLDTAGNGLEFWANPEGGEGYARLLDTAGNLVKNFVSDFGNAINYNFIVSNNKEDFAEVNTEAAIDLCPTRTTGKTVLNYYSGKPQDVTVQIIKDEDGILVEEHLYKNLKQGWFSYDLSYLPAQRYYVRLFVNGELKFTKRLRVEPKKGN